MVIYSVYLFFKPENLISVALNRRHLSEGQKAVLANEYRKIISKEAESKAGKKAVTIREIKRGNIDSETFSESIGEEQARSCTIAAEKYHVAERKGRDLGT